MANFPTETLASQQIVDITALRLEFQNDREQGDEVMAANWQNSVEDLFGGDGSVSSEDLIKTFSAGFDFYHSLGGSDQRERIFLEAMGFVNRRESQYKSSYQQAVKILTGQALVAALNEIDQMKPNPVLTKNIRKTDVSKKELTQAIGGTTYVFRGYQSVNRLMDNNRGNLERITKVGETLLKA